MKRIVSVAFVICGAFFSLSAQNTIIAGVTDLIVAHRYEDAHALLDSLLAQQENNIDALMMKGNVILNHTLDTSKLMDFITEDDESIFSFSLSHKPKKLSEQAAAQVAAYWNKCLLLDSSRIDIIKGLCSVYSMALMEDSLKQEIFRLKKTEADDGEQAYRIATYARNFKERNRFDEAMDIYKFIALQYPDLAGIRCDIASEYYYKGHLIEALAWLDSTYNFKTVDETSFLNGAFIYSELGYFDNAQNVLNTYSRVYDRQMDKFYYGLRLFADSSDKYVEVLTSFCESVDTFSYTQEYELAQKLIAFKQYFSMATYKALVSQTEIPDYYKVLIHQRAIRQFRFCEPFVWYGIHFNKVKNYSSAVQLLEEINNCPNDFEEYNNALLNYGYALQKTGDHQRALSTFSRLFNASECVVKEAALYFSAKIKLEQNLPEESRSYLREILNSKQSFENSQLGNYGYFELARRLLLTLN